MFITDDGWFDSLWIEANRKYVLLVENFDGMQGVLRGEAMFGTQEIIDITDFDIVDHR